MALNVDTGSYINTTFYYQVANVVDRPLSNQTDQPDFDRLSVEAQYSMNQALDRLDQKGIRRVSTINYTNSETDEKDQ